MRIQRKRKTTEEGYWKTATDLMAGILMIVILIMMLLLLYLTQLRKEDYKDPDNGNHYHSATDDQAEQPTHYKDEDHNQTHEHDNDDNGGGGGSGEDEPGDNIDAGKEQNGKDKTAVFVTAVDEETGNVIKKQGILFELYTDKNGIGGLQTLYTYYPKKTEYRKFETTKAGTFYLPEKIIKGRYSLHNMIAPVGYSLAEDIDFEITEQLDWNEPYRIEVPFSSLKSIIRVQSVDSETKAPVAGSVFEVIAQENITTADGTLRCRKGEVADTFTCDNKGYGASKKLYLGRYIVRQKEAPEFYAVSDITLEVKTVQTQTKTDILTVECTKTAAYITLRDEYTQESIRGAVYTINDTEKMTTDSGGVIKLTDLQKDKTYTVSLTALPEPYRKSSDGLTFTVDRNGRIDGNAVLNTDLTAYVTRISVSLKDVLFQMNVDGKAVKLRDSNDNIVETWSSDQKDWIIEGLEPGNYSISIGDDGSYLTRFVLSDDGNVQTVELHIWTIIDTAAVIVAAGLLAAGVFLILRIRRRRRAKINERR